MKKKILFTIALCFLTLFFSVQTIYATTMDDLYACTIYSDHYSNLSDIETSMINAIYAYFWRGYMGNSVVNPSSTIFASNVFSRQVQLYFCHGNHELIAFESGARINSWR